MLIRQIRSFGSLSKEHGVHAGHIHVRKPEVSFKAPTYFIGGSNSSSTRQGGFILLVFTIAMFQARNINRKIKESVSKTNTEFQKKLKVFCVDLKMFFKNNSGSIKKPFSLQKSSLNSIVLASISQKQS